MGKNLNAVVTKTATRWKERAKKDRANRRNISRAQAFALELMEYMELHNIKQKDLANKMGVTPQQVNKILRAKANLTFETLDKIADALNVRIPPPKIRTKISASSPMVHYSMTVAYNKRTNKKIEEDLTTTRIIKKNPVLDASMKSLDSYTYTAKQI